MKIRKQVYELTLDDVRKFPVWEFALDEEGEDGQDKATVRPYEISGPLDSADGPLIFGHCSHSRTTRRCTAALTTPAHDDEGLGRLQPVIITERGHVLFWRGVIAPDSQTVAHSYAKLGRDAASTFPIQVVSDVGS